jgi:GNAT superfamily N-acetyltransferase
MLVRAATPEDHGWVVGVLTDRWGATGVVSRGELHDASALPAFVALDGDERVGLLTYHLADGELEVVTLDALRASAGVGTALLEAVRARARAEGCRRLWLITSNDNLKALRFYQKRGLRLVAVHAGALDRARELKPGIPALGDDGIAVHDEIELEDDLRSPVPLAQRNPR